MATFKLKTLTGPLEFYAPDGGGYVRVYPAGRQICSGGGYLGPALEANRANLESVARRWWRQHRDSQKPQRSN